MALGGIDARVKNKAETREGTSRRLNASQARRTIGGRFADRPLGQPARKPEAQSLSAMFKQGAAPLPRSSWSCPRLTSPLAAGLCSDPFVIAKPFFFEGRRAEMAQRRVKPAMIGEARPVDRFVPGLTARRKAHCAQPLELQRAERRFAHRLVPQSPLRLIEPRLPKIASCSSRPAAQIRT